MTPNSSSGTPVRLWWLSLLAGLLPLAGIAVAFSLAVAEGQFAWCNPLIEGCVSISRAGRHGLPNVLFRAFLLPAAVLQGLVWWLSASWLRTLVPAHARGSIDTQGASDRPRRAALQWLPWLGLAAALFLILYGTFLGTEGPGYRWMRRYGVVFYFGFTCVLMVIVGGAVHRAAQSVVELRSAARLLIAVVIALPLLGLVNSLAPLFIADTDALDRFENATEWWGGGVFTVFFCLLALLWRRTKFSALLQRGRD